MTRSLVTWAVFLATQVVGVTASAKPSARLVADLDTRRTSLGASSILPVGNEAFLWISSNGTFRQLVRTDGTPEGTKTVHFDVGVGAGWVRRLGENLIVSKQDQSVGSGLFVSRGRPHDLALLADLAPESRTASGIAGAPVEAAGQLFFSLVDPPSSPLWRTDGTTDGTMRVPDRFGGRISWPVPTPSGDGVAFVTERPAAVHAIDGSNLTTETVFSSTTASFARILGQVGGRLFFETGEDGKGWLWSWDGGTTRLAGVLESPAWSTTRSADALYVYTSTGGISGTFRAADGQGRLTEVAETRGAVSAPIHHVAGYLFFAARDGAETRLIRTSVLTGESAPVAGVLNPRMDVAIGVGNYLYVEGESGPDERALFAVDAETGAAGVVPGTSYAVGDGGLVIGRLEDRVLLVVSGVLKIIEEPGDAAKTLWDLPAEQTRGETRILGSLGDQVIILSGRERLFASNGTEAGTELLASDVRIGGDVVDFAGRIYFVEGDEVDGRSVWSTDGTVGGTEPVDGVPEHVGRILLPIGERLMMLAGSEGPDDLVAYDPIRGEVETVVAEAGIDENLVAAVGPSLFYVTSEQRALWRLDAGEEEPLQLMTFGDGAPDELAGAEDRLFFWRDLRQGRWELWTSGAAPESTRLVSAFQTERFEAVVVERRLFFSTDDGLFVTNGAEIDRVSPHQMLRGWAHGSLLYFTSDGESTGVELFVSDGTSEGTHLVRDFYEGPGSGLPEVYSIAGRAYVSAVSKEHGAELFKTDGTSEGTRLFVEVAPGTSGSWPSDLVQAGDRLFFVGLAPKTGFEAYVVEIGDLATVDEGCGCSVTREGGRGGLWLLVALLLRRRRRACMGRRLGRGDACAAIPREDAPRDGGSGR